MNWEHYLEVGLSLFKCTDLLGYSDSVGTRENFRNRQLHVAKSYLRGCRKSVIVKQFVTTVTITEKDVMYWSDLMSCLKIGVFAMLYSWFPDQRRSSIKNKQFITWDISSDQVTNLRAKFKRKFVVRSFVRTVNYHVTLVLYSIKCSYKHYSYFQPKMKIIKIHLFLYSLFSLCCGFQLSILQKVSISQPERNNQENSRNLSLSTTHSV